MLAQKPSCTVHMCGDSTWFMHLRCLGFAASLSLWQSQNQHKEKGASSTKQHPWLEHRLQEQ